MPPYLLPLIPYFQDLKRRLTWQRATLLAVSPALAIGVATATAAGGAALATAGVTAGATAQVVERAAESKAGARAAQAGAAAGAVLGVASSVWVPGPAGAAVQVATEATVRAASLAVRATPAFQLGRAAKRSAAYQRGERLGQRVTRDGLDRIASALAPLGISPATTRAMARTLRLVTPPLMWPSVLAQPFLPGTIRGLGSAARARVATWKALAAARAEAQAEEASDQAEEASDQAEEASESVEEGAAVEAEAPEPRAGIATAITEATR